MLYLGILLQFVLEFIHTAHLIYNGHTKKKKDNTCGIGGGTTMTSFKNIVNMKTLIAVVWKAQQFARISMHLMMAKWAKIKF
jgi:hypothetical protein